MSHDLLIDDGRVLDLFTRIIIHWQMQNMLPFQTKLRSSSGGYSGRYTNTGRAWPQAPPVNNAVRTMKPPQMVFPASTDNMWRWVELIFEPGPIYVHHSNEVHGSHEPIIVWGECAWDPYLRDKCGLGIGVVIRDALVSILMAALSENRGKSTRV